MQTKLKNILLTGDYVSKGELKNDNQFTMFVTPFDNTVFTKGAKQILYIKTLKIQYKINSGTKLYKEVYELLWDRLGDIPTGNNDEIEEDYLHFTIGDDTDMIWHWFEDFFDISIGRDILNQ